MTRYAEFCANLQIIRIINVIDLHQKGHRQVIFFSNGVKCVTGSYGVHINANKGITHKKPPFEFVTTNIIFARGRICAKIFRNM